jgi:hypothetical protein
MLWQSVENELIVSRSCLSILCFMFQSNECMDKFDFGFKSCIFCNMVLCSKSANILEEHIASIFMIEE